MSPPIPNDATAAEKWPGPPLNTSFTNTGLNVRSGANGNQGSAEMALPEDLANAGKGLHPGWRTHASDHGSAARKNPNRDPNEWYVRRRASHKTCHCADTRHQNAGKRWTQDAREVELRRVECEARADLVTCDDRRYDRLKRRHRERVGNSNHHGKQDDHPRLDRPDHHQYDNCGRAQHLDRLEDSNDLASVRSIRERSAGQGEKPYRRIHSERIQSDQERRCAEGEQQPRLCDLLRPCADT
jgi:hypothetical protein